MDDVERHIALLRNLVTSGMSVNYRSHKYKEQRSTESVPCTKLLHDAEAHISSVGILELRVGMANIRGAAYRRSR